MGIYVIPSGGGESGKAPLIPWTEYQKRLPTLDELQAWENKYHPHLWGIVTGAVSGIFVIDCDTETAAQIFIADGLKPRVKTPHGGYHFYFKHPGFPIKTVAGILPGVDCRGEGGFVNFVGTVEDKEYDCLLPLEAA
jgi:hypothetical protein